MEMNVIDIDALATHWSPLVVVMNILSHYRSVLFPTRSYIV